MNNTELAFSILSSASDVAIIFLLAIQSWVLVKLLPEIKTVSKNSDTINKITPKNFLKMKEEFSYTNVVCGRSNDPNHIHTEACFN